jgi:hypothetical protein
VPQQTGGFEQQAYGAGQEGGMTPSHAAALQAAAAASTAAPHRPEDAYAYTNMQVVPNGHQPHYSASSVTPYEWHQFTRTYMQPVPSQGEYLNTATTLMALGGRDGVGSQGSGVENPGAVDHAAMHGSMGSHLQWPAVQYGSQTNGHVGH